MLLKTFILLSLIFIVSSPIYAQEIEYNEMHYPEDSLIEKPIKELLKENKIKPKKWYWVVELPFVSINKKQFEWYNILGTRKNARVIDMAYFVHSNADPRISLTFKVQSLVGYMFDEIGEGENKQMGLTRIIYIWHDPEVIKLTKEQRKTMKLKERKQGFYFFKDSPQGLVEINYDDLHFLKHYYLIEKLKKGDGFITQTFEVKPRVVSYRIHEYYPNARIKKMISIKDVQLKEPDVHGSHYVRAITNHIVDGPEIPPLRPNKPEEIYTTDTKHPYWLQNILRD